MNAKQPCSALRLSCFDLKFQLRLQQIAHFQVVGVGNSWGDARPKLRVLCQDSEKLKGPQQVLQWDSNYFPTSFPSISQFRPCKHATPFTSVSDTIATSCDAATATRNFATVTCSVLDRLPPQAVVDPGSSREGRSGSLLPQPNFECAGSYVYVYICMYTCIYIYMHTCVHTYAHIYVHTYAYRYD